MVGKGHGRNPCGRFRVQNAFCSPWKNKGSATNQTTMKMKNANEVAEWRLCVGCGACAYICPEENITLVNFTKEGIRPVYDPEKCRECGDCIKVCPGYETIKMRTLIKISFSIKGIKEKLGNHSGGMGGVCNRSRNQVQWLFRRSCQCPGPVLS